MYVENRQLKWNKKDISKQGVSRRVQDTMAKEDLSMKEMYKELYALKVKAKLYARIMVVFGLLVFFHFVSCLLLYP